MHTTYCQKSEIKDSKYYPSLVKAFPAQPTGPNCFETTQNIHYQWKSDLPGEWADKCN